MSKLRFAAVLVTGGIFLVACGAASPSPGAATKGEIAIATNLPVSGKDASSGLPTQHGAEFAVKQADKVCGASSHKNDCFKLSIVLFDDTVGGVHNEQKGAQNVDQIVANDKILGQVGPFNSGVAQAEIPKANRAKLAMISPANTNECLTKDVPESKCNPKPSALRPTGVNNYFRVAGPDTIQGPFVADYAFDTLNLTKVGVFSDLEPFGKGVADNFQRQFTKRGGQVVVRQDFEKTTTDFKAFLTKAKNAGAQGIYAGATSATNGCIPRQQMKDVGFASSVPFLGPDGIVDSQCVKDASAYAVNMYGSVATGNAEKNPDASSTVAAYKQAYPNKDDLAAYTFPAYDCAKILIAAISRAIDDANGNKPTRDQVRAQVAKTKDFKGTTGTITFDETGDLASPTMSVYQTKGTPVDWAFISQAFKYTPK